MELGRYVHNDDDSDDDDDDDDDDDRSGHNDVAVYVDDDVSPHVLYLIIYLFE